MVARGSRSLQIALEDEKSTLIWPWVVGGAAVVAGATIGGYFLFKPDPTPGKAPQGQLGTVYLPASWPR